MASADAAGLQEVRLFQFQQLDHAPIAVNELIVVVVSQLTDGFGPGAEGGEGCGF